MIKGNLPFQGHSIDEILENNKKCKIRLENSDPKVSFQAINFMKALLEVDPEKRLSATEALHHEWLQN